MRAAALPPPRKHARLVVKLLLLAAIVIGSVVLVAAQTMLKHQALAGNFPMRLRWNFHRLMLGQSMSFYQDEFAGRVSAKVMQTALSIRETVMKLMDVFVYVVVYFVGTVVLVSQADVWLVLPLVAIGLAVPFMPASALRTEASSSTTKTMGSVVVMDMALRARWRAL